MLLGSRSHGIVRNTVSILRLSSLQRQTWRFTATILRSNQCRNNSSSIEPVVADKPLATKSQARDASDKPFYVTTPIFYVNAAPHVGHLYSMVVADIIKRWQILQGKKALLSTGIDEHGMKVQRAAAAANIAPKTFCDGGAETFKSLAQVAGISNDYFVRTTDADHKEAVQYAWTLLQDRGHIYLSKHEGWYCVSDETYYPQSGVHLIVEPTSGRKIMASIETGKEVEWTSETNYRFRLSNFREPLLNYYAKHPHFVLPMTRMKDVVQHVTEGLEDLSVSRPRARLDWGIPVPTDDTQTIYVWLDALTNYITKAGYPWTPGQEAALGWPADCQVIGKDIVRFHCIYWPAFLMALDIPLPKHILTHGHWTLGREKMSKSTGNVVNPFWAIDRFGVDVMRFYLAHDGSVGKDADYNNEYIIERYKKALYAGFGNLTSRITRGKKWSIRRAVERATSGELQPWDDALCEKQYNSLQHIPEKFKHKMKHLDIHTATKNIMELIYSTNAFVQQTEPWTLVQGVQTHESQTKVDRIIYLSAEALRISGILLQPVMPEKMSNMLDMLGVAPEARTFEFAEVGKDAAYGQSRVDLGRGLIGVLFPPLISDE